MLQLFHKTLSTISVWRRRGTSKGVRGANSELVVAPAAVAVVAVTVAIIAVAAALFKHNLMTAHYNR